MKKIFNVILINERERGQGEEFDIIFYNTFLINERADI